MAASNVETNSNVLFGWIEPSFSDISTDPDSDLTDGIDNNNSYTKGTLFEISPDSGVGVTITHPDPIRQRVQTDRQISTKGLPGHKGATVDFSVRAIAGNTVLGVGDSPDGGPYADTILKVGLGTPLGSSATYQVCSGGTTTTSIVADATGYAEGLWCSITDTSGSIKELRQVIDVTGTTLTWHRALSFTCAASDIVRPMLTYEPHAYPFGRSTMYIKRRVRDDSPVDGLAHDVSGVGGNVSLENGETGSEMRFHFVGEGDDWTTKTAEKPDVSSALITDPAPLLVGSCLTIGTTEVEAASVSVDPRITLAAKGSTCGDQGRSGWTNQADLNGAMMTVDVMYNPDYLTAWTAGTLYNVEFYAGPKSKTTKIDANDCDYFVHHFPAAQFLGVEEVEVNNMIYLRLAFESVQSETAGHTGLSPYYLAVAGKTV